jgi:crotonobetainyl-CoA:carnitine CoA-transferase CaiB-like acyl-CoA transferase
MSGNSIQGQRLRYPVCLRCDGRDQLARVEAVVREGRYTGFVQGWVAGRDGYDVPIQARMVQTTGLARSLAPPGRPLAATGWAVVSAVAVVLMLGAASMVFNAPANGGAWVCTAMIAVVSVASVVVWFARLRAGQRMGSLVEGARWLWRRSWYCHRCGLVSVLTPNGSTVVDSRDLASSLIELSGRTQWRVRGAGKQLEA